MHFKKDYKTATGYSAKCCKKMSLQAAAKQNASYAYLLLVGMSGEDMTYTFQQMYLVCIGSNEAVNAAREWLTSQPEAGAAYSIESRRA